MTFSLKKGKKVKCQNVKIYFIFVSLFSFYIDSSYYRIKDIYILRIHACNVHLTGYICVYVPCISLCNKAGVDMEDREITR